MTSPPRLYALCSHDTATGCATTIAAVVGVAADGTTHVSWIPLEHVAAGPWRERIRSATTPLPETIDWWAQNANGVTTDVIELPVSGVDGDVVARVEAAVDDILTHPRT